MIFLILKPVSKRSTARPSSSSPSAFSSGPVPEVCSVDKTRFPGGSGYDVFRSVYKSIRKVLRFEDRGFFERFASAESKYGKGKAYKIYLKNAYCTLFMFQESQISEK